MEQLVELWSLLPIFIAWSTAIFGKAIFSRLNHIYIPSSKALKMYFLFSVILSYCTYLKKSSIQIFLARVLLALFSILLFVFIQIERVRCCAILAAASAVCKVQTETSTFFSTLIPVLSSQAQVGQGCVTDRIVNYPTKHIYPQKGSQIHGQP